MADQPDTKGGSVIPPKINLSRPGGAGNDSGQEQARPGAGPAAPARPKLIRINLPDVPLPPEQPRPSAPRAAVPAESAGAKHQTSRIPLDAAAPPQGAPPGKTSRIPGVPKLEMPAARPPLSTADAPARLDEVAASKRQTSRISLEAAFTPEEENAEAAQPKTIRLKRPSDEGAAEAPEAAKPLSSTARIDHEGEAAAEEPSPGRRKTIRVKRTAGAPAEEEALAQPEMDAPLPVLEVEEKVSWIFPAFAVAAVVVIGVAIYVLAAQAFGPNASLTRLSYGASSLNLSWPGKVNAD